MSRPFNFSISCNSLSACKSISRPFIASMSLKALASRTAFSASSLLRPRRTAKPRSSAARSFSCFAQNGVHCLSQQHGRRSARVRTGSHCGHVSCLQQEKTSRGRSSAGRGYIRYNRHWGSEDFLHNLPRRIQQSAGRVEADQNQLRTLCLRLRDGISNDFGRHGVYGPIERNAQDERRMLAGRYF
jgi:hypothetical protein